MNKHLFRLILLASLSFTVSPTWAEVYRWVDPQGNVHFGDKAHTKLQATDISQQLKLNNLDHSANRTEQSLQHMDLRQQAQATETQQKQSQRNAGSEQRARQCQDVERRLSILRGRVVFYDDNNQPVKVTEQERQQRADSLAQQVDHYCR